MNAEPEPSSLNPDIRNAGKKIVYFVRKYDDLHLSLACHAAFPLVLTPDLLYQIWAEFVSDVPWVSVAHLLLSPLCREVSYEVFEMELSVRDLLLEELEGREGQGRLKKLADFMIAYVEKFLVGYDADTKNLRERHTLISLAYTNPNEAARRLAQKLSDGVKTTDVREAFRWTTLGKTLVTPLGKAGFKPLLTYNDLLFHYARGEIHQHQALIEAFGQEKKQLEGRLAIGELKLPDDVSRLLTTTPISVPVSVQSLPSLPRIVSETDLNRLIERMGINLCSWSIQIATLIFEEELSKSNFETIYINKQGKIIRTQKCEAYYYEEPLETIPPTPLKKGDKSEVQNLTLIAIPEGEYWMGSPEDEKDRDDDESPQHLVKVPAFFMSQTPITEAQWKFVANLPQEQKALETNSFRNRDDHPVVNISWQDAIEFCARLSRHTGRNYRLPSEAEWEYACRALPLDSESIQDTPPFHFGETITSELANYDGSVIYQEEPKGKNRGKTTSVRSFKPNAFGLYDMHGNAWEWCLDPWHGNYQGAPSDSRVWDEEDNDNRYQNILDSINILIKDGRAHVIRGGSWIDDPWGCRSAYRDDIDDRDGSNGFRVVCAPQDL